MFEKKTKEKRENKEINKQIKYKKNKENKIKIKKNNLFIQKNSETNTIFHSQNTRNILFFKTFFDAFCGKDVISCLGYIA